MRYWNLFIGAALTGFLLTHMTMAERLLTFFASLLFVAPGIKSGFVGLLLMLPIIISQIYKHIAAKKQVLST